MTDEDKPRFVAVMYWLAKKYPLRKGQEMVPRKLTTEDLADWFEVLRDVHIERLEWAAKYHFGHSSFFPAPADLRNWSPMAPTPKRLPLKDAKLIAEYPAPTDESRRKLQEVFDMANKTFGTRLRVQF